MRRAAWIVLVVPLAAGVRAGPACGAPPAIDGTMLAAPLLEADGPPRLVLAQRTITREWGPSDDSTYVVISVPEWRSEGFAAAGSALVPGSGQLYTGETGGALLFALAEAAGWTARLLWMRRSDELLDESAAFAGDPADTASAWSFGRWESSTAGDASEMRRLYVADREAFYHRIGSDPAYAAGWEGGDPTRLAYRSTYDRSQHFERRARHAGEALWLNHLVAAVDALRAARLHNLTLAPRTSLQLRSGWRHGPSLRAAVERRF